jgi:hypothetical protein
MVTRSKTRTIITEHAQEAVSNLQNFILLLLQFAKQEREREREREREKKKKKEDIIATESRAVLNFQN